MRFGKAMPTTGLMPDATVAAVDVDALKDSSRRRDASVVAAEPEARARVLASAQADVSSP